MYSLGVLVFELWHPFSTGMERVVLLRELREAGRLPSAWEAAHPQVARLVRCVYIHVCACACACNLYLLVSAHVRRGVLQDVRAASGMQILPANAVASLSHARKPFPASSQPPLLRCPLRRCDLSPTPVPTLNHTPVPTLNHAVLSAVCVPQLAHVCQAQRPAVSTAGAAERPAASTT